MRPDHGGVAFVRGTDFPGYPARPPWLPSRSKGVFAHAPDRPARYGQDAGDAVHDKASHGSVQCPGFYPVSADGSVKSMDFLQSGLSGVHVTGGTPVFSSV